MMSNKGKLIVVSGPSGAGKSTVIHMLMSKRDDVRFSVSATTRAPRTGEVDGQDYFFITSEKFEEMISNGELLEHARYVNNYYGTPKAPVERMLSDGKDVILDIEVQGAAQVSKAMPEAILVFLIPQSFAELEKRLRARNKDTEEKILARLERAKVEYKEAGKYEYIVINDVPEKAAAELESIITAEKCKTADRINYTEV